MVHGKKAMAEAEGARRRRLREWVRNGLAGLVFGVSFIGAGWLALEGAKRLGFEFKFSLAEQTAEPRFQLTDHTGRAVTERRFLGRPAIFFFGYTYCPDICPTHLVTLAEVVDRLRADGTPVQAIFVSVDPERDTVAEMKNYVTQLGSGLTGLTGTLDQVAAAANAFGAYYRKVQKKPDTPYVMDHSAFSYLTDAKGRLIATLQPPRDPASMLAKIRSFLEKSAGSSG